MQNYIKYLAAFHLSVFFLLSACSKKESSPVAPPNNGSNRTAEIGEFWEWINSGESTQFHAISFAGPNTGIVAGYYGNILKTQDGGNSWTVVSDQSTGKINALVCLTTETFIATYNYGEILKSNDSGQTWQTIRVADDELFDIAFLDGRTGTMVGPSESIFRTINAANSWKEIPLGFSAYYLNNCQYLNSNVLYISGNISPEPAPMMPMLIKSTNSDDDFEKLLLSEFSGNEVYSMHFLDEKIGFFCGPDKFLIKTTNGGADWERSTLPAKLDSLKDHAVSFVDILFPDDTIGFTIGSVLSESGGRGFVLKTIDCGETWRNIPLAEYSYFKDIYYAPGGQLFIVGDDGLILKSN